jgi:hypothetical protein
MTNCGLETVEQSGAKLGHAPVRLKEVNRINYMENEIKEPATKGNETETPHDHIGKLIVSVGGFACATLIFGSLMGAPSPAAVAACGLCFMGAACRFSCCAGGEARSGLPCQQFRFSSKKSVTYASGTKEVRFLKSK